MSRRERRAAAKGSGTAPKAATADTPFALHEAGLAHFHAGRLLDAQLCCQQALALETNHADALHLMGLVSIEAGQHDHAVEWISRALRQDPRPEFLASLGTALQRQERYDDALKVVDKAVQLKPDDAELWRQLGDLLVQSSRVDEALLSYQHVLKLDPAHQDALYKSGALLNQSGRHAEAIGHLDLVLADHVPALKVRAQVLHNLKRFEEAVATGKRADQLEPGKGDTCNNIGVTLWVLGRYEESLEWFDKALAVAPDMVAALDNKIASLSELMRFEEIFALHDRMKSLGLNTTDTDWNLSLAHLLTGNFEAGWPGHGARLKLSSARYPKFPQPMWLGEQDIKGKTILVCADEGLGDTIQFVRYVPRLAERGARVVLAVQESLQVLLKDLQGVARCVPLSAATSQTFDLHCPISSLPLAFGTRLDTIPSAISYLPAPSASHVQAWQERLGPRSGLRVGLAWSGRSTHTNDRNRSIPLRMLATLLDINATFVSLQKDPRPDDAAFLRERGDIVDLTMYLTDFSETAALVSCLDLVITVDTSVAHLAAALGRPTWVLLPHRPDYRWLLDRDDSPWYPSVRLFRQTAAREYASVIERVRSELEQMASRRGPGSAARSPRTASKATTDTPLTLYETGLAHFQAGRFADARLCCQKALALDAQYADALHLMGRVAISVERYDQAIEWISRALRQDPKPGYLASLGTALQQQERYEDAVKVVDKAIQLKPDDAELWRQLGDILVQSSQVEQALLSYQHVLKLDPKHQDALYKSGALLHQLGRYTEAITHLDLAHEVLPDHAPTLQVRARTLHKLNRVEDALDCGKLAHRLEPGDADTCNNIGAALRLLDRNEEAVGWFDKALKIEPKLVIALDNKIASLFRLHRFDEMFALHDRMKSLGLNTVETEWNMSLAYLITGNFEAGWRGHGARLKLPSALYPKYQQPMWLGEQDVKGKTVFVCTDEGLGDTIQFVRYVPWLAERGARVILAVQDPLRELLAGVSGVSQCLPVSALTKLPEFDLHCPISSLPLAFATRLDTIPSAPYLPPLAPGRVQAWEERLGPRRKLRVGLVWSGSLAHGNDRHRSIPLRMFSGLLEADASFVSLQKDPRPSDAAVLRERSDIFDLTADLTDFTETAALISCLDLVITVDTSVAHLAAALGRPTWILLPYAPDYRWLLGRDDSPWYPSVRLFRQTASREYGSVLERMRTELTQLASQTDRAV